MMPGNAPLVTVIIPTYRGDRLEFLRESVASIQRQSHPYLEILIVVDGGVSSETEAFLAEAAGDARLRVLRLPGNQGPARARNEGIAEAAGQFVAFLDADDVAEPERIEQQLTYIDAQRADIVGSYYRLVDEEGRVIGRKRVPIGPEQVRRALWMLNPVGNSTVLARAQVLKGRPFREQGRGPATYGEDYELWVRLVREGFVVCNQPEYLVRFRVGPQHMSRRRGFRRFASDFEVRLHTLPLYPALLRPPIACASLVLAALRLLPARWLAMVYMLRNRLGFR